jgi:lipoprotein-anchoring transpeptidase ErfK/SrfK
VRGRVSLAALVVGWLVTGCAAVHPARQTAGNAVVSPSPATRSIASTPTVPAPAKARAAPDACVHNTAGQLVLVDVAKQRVWMCAGRHTVFQSAVTTGMVGEYTATPTGTYQVQDKVRDTSLTLITGESYAVKYWVPFDAPLFGFHDSSWQAFPYGSPRYRTEGSHGCIHMPLAAMKFLVDWAQVGATVTIHA